MSKRIMLVPNLLLLCCALILYHRSFLAGQLTKAGLLVTFAALLPLCYAATGKMWWQLKLITALINAALFAMAAYIFSATSYMLIKNDMLSFTVYALLLVSWLLAVAAAATNNKRPFVTVIFNVVLLVCAAITYYLRATMQWSPSLNAALFGSMMMVSALNIYCLLYPFRFKK